MARPTDLAEDAPLSIDWRQRDVFRSPVRDQGQGAEFCWGYAVSGCLEGTYNSKQEDVTKRVQLSTQELLNCVPTTQEGRVTKLKKVYNFIADKGLSLEEDCPYKGGKRLPCRPHRNQNRAIRCQYGVEVANVDERVLLGLVAQHPVSATLIATLQLAGCANKNQIYEGVPGMPSSEVVEHSVVIAGYGTEHDGRNYFLIRNSYGERWGDGGYCKVLRQSSSNRRSIFASYSYPVL